MDKKIGVILTFVVTMIFNIMAPILVVNTVKDYTAKSEIVGSPSDEIVISNYVLTSDYVFQENLSKINYVIDEDSGYYLYSYYFSAKEFDATKNNYAVFINDYMCGITALQPKAMTCTYTMTFKDINKDVLNTLDIEITFEFYSSYSYLLLKIDTEDITYFNGFRENPGFVLTLSKVDYGMSGLIGQSGEQLEIIELQQQLNDLQNSKDELQNLYDSLAEDYDEQSTEMTTLRNQITTLEATIDSLEKQVADLQAKIDAYDKVGKIEVVYQSEGATYSAEIIESGASPAEVPTLEHTTTSHFAGWSIDGETVIDPTTMTLTENTTFIAVWRTEVGDWLLNEEYSTTTSVYGFSSREMTITETGITYYSEGTQRTITIHTITISLGAGGEYYDLEYDATNDVINVYYRLGANTDDTPSYVFSRA